jgi:hypothetical protein
VNLGEGVAADSRVAAASERPAASLSLRARILLWDFERGSLAYDLLCLFLVLLLVAVPAAWWGDPMITRP